MFLMFHWLYYSVTISESKKSFRLIFCCFSAMQMFVALLSSSDFLMKLICWRMLVFFYHDKSIAIIKDGSLKYYLLSINALKYLIIIRACNTYQKNLS